MALRITKSLGSGAIAPHPDVDAGVIPFEFLESCQSRVYVLRNMLSGIIAMTATRAQATLSHSKPAP